MAETVAIRCSLTLAKWLGARTCGEAELHETWFNCSTRSHKNFRVIPVDGPNMAPLIWWKWPVVQPNSNSETKFWEP